MYLQDEPFSDPFELSHTTGANPAGKQALPQEQRSNEYASHAATEAHSAFTPIREHFPEAGSKYLGGTCDGYVYRTIFRGRTLSHSYEMVVSFLQEHGYGDIPLPADADELLLFRLPTRNRQILMFEDNGYVHNPIKILFPIHARQVRPRTLILELYNEQAPKHLLRFHRKIE